MKEGDDKSHGSNAVDPPPAPVQPTEAAQHRSPLTKEAPDGKVQDGFIAPRRKRISGAEQKRRAKARREALEATSDKAQPSSSSQAGTSANCPTNTKQAAKQAGRTPANRPAPTKQGRLAGSSANRQKHPQAARSADTRGQPLKKRHRSDESASPGINPRKRPTMEEGATPISYKEAVNAHLHVAIIDLRSTTGKISEDAARTIKGDLKLQLRNTIEQEAEAPQFSKWSYAGETFRINCADEAALHWLEKAVPMLPCNTSKTYKLVQASKIPKLTKMKLWVPGAKAEDTKETMLWLQKQNRNLNATEWPIFHTESHEDGSLLIFGVPEAETAIIKGMNGRVFFEFSTLKIQYPNEGSKTQPGEVQPAGVEQTPHMETTP